MTAEFDVVNKDRILGGGEYAQVNLQMRRPEATFWLPVTSVVQAQSGVFILRKEGQFIKRVPVMPGMRKGALTEVFGDLDIRDQVLKRGAEEWKDGQKM
ncbi:hypothetical protein D3C86_1759880 [compost metagenome]